MVIARRLMIAAVACFTLIAPGWAIVGVGLHYGVDLTLKMDDKVGETLDFLEFDLSKFPGVDTAAFSALGIETKLTGKNIPIYVDRFDWVRNPVNFGGKAFIDIIPVLDAVEISANFGMWEYRGQLRYPKVDTTGIGSKQNPTINDVLVFETTELTLESVGMPNYFGLLQGTPYAKLHFDATIRKNVVSLPMKVLRIYAGGGPSLHFATPVLSPSLIEDVMGVKLEGMSSDSLSSLFSDPKALKPVLEEIVTSLFIPHFGMHLVAGAMVKLPVIPVGFYVDGKLMIPFGQLDKHVDVGGRGFLVNAGVTLGL